MTSEKKKAPITRQRLECPVRWIFQHRWLHQLEQKAGHKTCCLDDQPNFQSRTPKPCARKYKPARRNLLKLKSSALFSCIYPIITGGCFLDRKSYKWTRTIRMRIRSLQDDIIVKHVFFPSVDKLGSWSSCPNGTSLGFDQNDGRLLRIKSGSPFTKVNTDDIPESGPTGLSHFNHTSIQFGQDSRRRMERQLRGQWNKGLL